MSKTERLRQQHQELLDIVGQLVPLLNEGALAQNAAEAYGHLSKLSGKLNVHLAMEDKVFYPGLLKHSDPNVVKKAQAFIDEMGGIKDAYGAYAKKWANSNAIQSSPGDFINDTKGVINVLGQRIDKENNDLYAMVDKMD